MAETISSSLPESYSRDDENLKNKRVQYKEIEGRIYEAEKSLEVLGRCLRNESGTDFGMYAEMDNATLLEKEREIKENLETLRKDEMLLRLKILLMEENIELGSKILGLAGTENGKDTKPTLN
jgi:hypothetical protein